jgi:hypothetical protein
MLEPYNLVLVTRMEVVCGGECFYRGRDPMLKGALDIGGRKVIK